MSTALRRRRGAPDSNQRREDGPLHVVVLMGGVGTERNVSLASGQGVSDALRERGHRVESWVLDSDRPQDLDALPREADVVFLALHGEYGEDGRIQAALEERGFCYTGSGPRASEVAFDKHATKVALAAAGVPLAPHRLLDWPVTERDLRQALRLYTPGETVVVKPTRMGSSVGVVICPDRRTLVRALAENVRWGQPLMIEDFVPGRELTVGILDGEALPLVEPVPLGGTYDYRAKYDRASGTCYRIEPEDIPPAIRALARHYARESHRALGCRHASRVDIRYDPDTERLAVLEVNTIPGMTPTSLLPKAAQAAGISFPALVDRLCRLALRVTS